MQTINNKSELHDPSKLIRKVKILSFILLPRSVEKIAGQDFNGTMKVEFDGFCQFTLVSD